MRCILRSPRSIKQVSAIFNCSSITRSKVTADMDHEIYKNASPDSMRKLFRNGKLKKHQTSGLCQNFVQANIAIVHSDYADDFKKFVDLNNAPCPLLYQSKCGEVGAPLLAKDSDIRTDLSAYRVYKDGAFDHIAYDLTDVEWQNMVAFYFGCSFTFDNRLLSAGIPVRNIDEGKNVSMYTTNIQCNEAGPFTCNMVVSMRPMPSSVIDKAVNETLQLDFLHGAPIHIGDPALIGIDDVRITIADFVTPHEGDVPVFWACGVTSGHAVCSARMPLAFSHAPGGMFLCDMTASEAESHFQTRKYPEAKAVCLDEAQQIYSLLSCDAWNGISKMENVILEDPGNRGVKYLSECGDLHYAALSISQSAKSVAIITGFPCFPENKPSIENDGISGAIAIARAVQALGKPATLIVGENEKAIFKDIVFWCHSNGFFKREVPVIVMDNASSMLYDDLTDQKRFSHLISIECPGRNHQGKYTTMNKRNISEFCDPLDELFLEAKKHPEIVTIGIGDGGNEIGMGKVFERVAANVQYGSEIACTIASDYLISAGVSNWGGYALAKAIFMCVSCPVHERYRRRGIGHACQFAMTDFVSTIDQEKTLLQYQASLGICDGINKQAGMTVDNINFEPVHANKITEIINI